MTTAGRLLTCLGLMAGAAALPAAQAETRWDLPTAYADTNFHTENLARFAIEVDRATGGRLKIMLHTDGTLFRAPEIKRAVQGGQAQIGEILLANHAAEHPVYGLDSMPFLATDYADARRLYEAQKPALEKLLAAQGMKLLFAVAWPPQGIFSRKTLQTGADLRGMKWRVHSPATSRLAERVGASPVQVQAADLSRALAAGLVDGFISSAATGLDTRTHEHLKHFYDLQAWLPKNAVIANLQALYELEAPVRDALLRAAADAEARGWLASQDRNEHDKAQLQRKGMGVHAPPPRLVADLRHAGTALLAEWEKLAGPDGHTIIAAYRHAAPSRHGTAAWRRALP